MDPKPTGLSPRSTVQGRPRATSTRDDPCARCGRNIPRLAANWPEGRLCNICYYDAVHTRGTCPECLQDRLLPGLRATDRQPICSTCAEIPVDFHCERCDVEAARHRGRLCVRCALRDDLHGLLGGVPSDPALLGLVDALCASDRPESILVWKWSAKVQELLERTARILTQAPKDKSKLYALHAPEVECISKGKARTPYEFGVKVSIATTLKEGLVVGMRSMPGNPHDGHTLAETLEQVGILTGTDRLPATAIVDKGYRGVEVEGVRILRSGQKRGITKALKAMIKRRSAIKPMIGHMKMDGRLARNPLKGQLGDALHAVMCGAGHNLRLILAALRLYCARFGLALQTLIAALIAEQVDHRRVCC